MSERKRFLEKQLDHAEAKKLGRVETLYTLDEGGKTKITSEARSARKSPRLVTLEMTPAGRKRGVKAP